MKTTSLLIFTSVFGLFVAAGTAHAATSTAAKKFQTEVNFTNPEKFADIKDDSMGSEKGREHYLLEFRDHIQKRAKDYLPEGYKLSVTITEIDLAGDFEPWRSGANDIRIVRSNYPPRIDLSYVLTDPNGNEVKKEGQKLRELMFEALITLDRSDPLRYEKEILNDWLRAEFSSLKKKK